MDISIALEKIGLDEKKQRLYKAALELGKASISELAKRANLKRPTAYNAIGELEISGLISQIKIGKSKLYSPAHPKRLLDIARSVEGQVESSIPELMAIYNSPKEKPKIQVFEGVKNVKLIYQELYEFLNTNQEVLCFTRIDAVREHMPEAIDYYMELSKKVINPHVRELNYGNEAGYEWVKETKPFLGINHFARILPPDFEFGFCDNIIYGNKVAIFSLKKDIFVIVIESEDIAKTYRAMFNWAWEMGKEVD